MSKYFSPETCELLEKLGLTSESGRYYPQNGSTALGIVTLVDSLKYKIEDLIPCFSSADIILSAENAKKLWGDSFHSYDEELGDATCEGNCGNPYDYDTCYKEHSHRLLTIMFEGDDIEPLIAEAAKQRLEGK